MESIFVLVIWTVVGVGGAGTQHAKYWEVERDWRPIAEFHAYKYTDAKNKCEAGARSLGIEPRSYRCINTK